MVKIDKIKGIMAERGYTQKSLAEKMEMSEATLTRRLKDGDFTLAEAESMIEVLNIPNPAEIFFAMN